MLLNVGINFLIEKQLISNMYRIHLTELSISSRAFDTTSAPHYAPLLGIVWFAPWPWSHRIAQTTTKMCRETRAEMGEGWWGEVNLVVAGVRTISCPLDDTIYFWLSWASSARHDDHQKGQLSRRPRCACFRFFPNAKPFVTIVVVVVVFVVVVYS